MPALLLKHWRLLAVLLLCLGSFAAGRWGGSYTKTVDKTSDHISDHTTDTQKTDETVQDKDVTQTDKVTTITKKPDGTVTTTIVDHTKVVDNSKKTEDETDKKTEQKVETKTETKETVSSGGASSSDRYNLSLSATNGISLKWSPDYQAQIGYRIIGPIWGNAIYDISTHKPGIGLSITFP